MKRYEGLGVYFYTGTTQTGKSIAALAAAWKHQDATGWPILIIDSQGVWNFEGYPHAKTVEEAVRRVWAVDEVGKPKEKAVAFTPTDVAEVESLYSAARAGRRVILLCDECRFWLSARRLPDALSRALRVWAHSELVLLFTTQRLADVHGDALACHREIYVFKTVGRPDLDRLEDEYEVNRERVMALEDGRFLTVRWNKLIEGGADADDGKTEKTGSPAAGAPDGRVLESGVRPPPRPGDPDGPPVPGGMGPGAPGEGAGGREEEKV